MIFFELSVSDTNMITLNNISLLRGGKLLFADVNLAFYKKQKIGVIGRNGSGKSSLFSLILDELEPDTGSVEISSGTKIVHLEQEIPAGKRNCVDYVIDIDTRLRELERKLKEVESHHDGVQIAKVHADYEHAGGYIAYARAATLLSGLGIPAEEQHKTIDELSGGLRRRLNLARALFVSSDALLLDEPTNHLDVESVIWLESFLKKYSGIILIISHDRDFLDNVANSIVEIEHESINSYTGNYSDFESLKARKLELQEKNFQQQQEKIAHLEDFVRRFRAKASKARQAQSRIKALEKMELVAPIFRSLPFTFEFYATSAPNTLLTLEQVEFAYAEQAVFKQLNLVLENGMRVGLLGPNGSGKTTLMKLLIGELAPQSGSREVNKKTRIGYFAQQQVDQLDLTASPLTHLRRMAPDIPETELRKFLGRFNFRDAMALAAIEHFSGGEKARLALALVVWQKPNLLLLDEPTNHLDLDMREALSLALQSFEGALILVSHDRYLLRSTVDSFLVIANKNIIKFEGDLQDYQSWLAAQTLEVEPDVVTEILKPIAKSGGLSKNRLAKLERDLEIITSRLAAIDQELVSAEIYQPTNQGQLKQILAEQKELQVKRNSLEDMWLEANL